jgi:hypothetical protein
VTGYSFAGYEAVLIIWGIVWILFGSGLVYLLVRYFAREDAEAGDQAPAIAEPTTAPARTVTPERELIAVGR